MPNVYTVEEVEEGKLVFERAELVITDARPNPDETMDGHCLITLSNERVLRIEAGGIMDEREVEDETYAVVCWEELLQLLDAMRAARKQERLN